MIEFLYYIIKFRKFNNAEDWVREINQLLKDEINEDKVNNKHLSSEYLVQQYFNDLKFFLRK